MRARDWRRGLLIGILILVALWLGSLIWSLGGKAHIAVREAEEAKRQYEALEERKAMLEANLGALETDRGRDGAIRTAFGVARPGEEVIVVVPPASSTPTSTPPWWKRLFNWFR